MKVIIDFLKRRNQKTFGVSYSPEYKTFIHHRVASDRQHPLQIPQKRELNARRREGLWWHVTSGLELSKSSVVRSWCRRRLRNAFLEGLKDRGFDEFGRLVDLDILIRKHEGFDPMLARDKEFQLRGSVKLHITPALVTTKYVDVRKETNGLLDILIEGAKVDLRSSHRSTPEHRTSLPAFRKVSQQQTRSSMPLRSSPPPQSNVPKVRPQNNISFSSESRTQPGIRLPDNIRRQPTPTS